MRIIILFILFISTHTHSYDTSSIYFYSPYYERNYIPVLLEDNDIYSHIILTNKKITELVNSQYFESKYDTSSKDFLVKFNSLLLSNMDDGYFKINTRLLKTAFTRDNKPFTYKDWQFALVSKDTDFNSKYYKTKLTCLDSKKETGDLLSNCFNVNISANDKYFLFKNGYLVHESGFVRSIRISIRGL